jgi:uncharacterized protein (DUF1778 family)
MKPFTESPLLTTVQQCVIDALAAGATLTAAAEANGLNRVTIYRWMKTHKQFSAALHQARAEFVLARRDDLHYLSNRALEALLAILDNPRSSPAVLLRTAMFILQRPQLPKTGWSMPEPAPAPDSEKLIDSAIIEQDYDSLPGLQDIERNAETFTPPEPAAPPETPATPPSDASECNAMQHDLPICDDVTSAASDPLPSPPATRHQPAKMPEDIDMIRSMEDALQSKS